MMKEIRPPRWADRFLTWYCNPDLLEEIQGDAWQLYFERLEAEGKRNADLKYIWDVIRFCRWSNIRKPGAGDLVNARAIWKFNFKIAARNAEKNKTIFGIKSLGLSLCIAFSLVLTAYIVNELTFDKFHKNHERLYRVVSNVTFPDHTTHYAVTPLPLGNVLTEAIPEISSFTRLLYQEQTVLRVDDKVFSSEKIFAADTSFLRLFTFGFQHGSQNALDGPDKIVLTESLAKRIFGTDNPIGKTVEFGNHYLMEVTAVISDPPANSHLQFHALVSWNSFRHNDAWENINAYTYVLLQEGATLESVEQKMLAVIATFHDLIARGYNATYEPVLQKISDIHFSSARDEDIAERGNKTNVYILLLVIFLFVISGVVNYLNLTLTELTANLRKMGMIRIFAGFQNGQNKVVLADLLFVLIVAAPLVLIMVYFGVDLAREYFSIGISPSVLAHPWFLGLIGIFVAFLILSSKLNAIVLTKAGHVIACLQGRMSIKGAGNGLRKFLVCTQLCFSIIMIALICVVVDQFQFIQNADKGFDDKNTIVIELPRDEPRNIENFTEELRAIPGITKVDGSSYYPGIIETKYVFEVETEKGMEQVLVPMMLCGYDYLDALGIEMESGRFFSRKEISDQYAAYIINKTAAKQFGWTDAIGKRVRGPMTGENEFFRDGEVIGVTEDFNFATLHNRIEPVIIFLEGEHWGGQFLYAKLDPVHPDDLIKTIAEKFAGQWPGQPFDWQYLDAKYLSLYKKDYEVKDIFEVGLVISIIISCLAVFSISALINVMRIKEMGIRRVMGASGVNVFYLHIKGLLYFTVLAAIAACPVIWFASDQWLQNFAYHIPVSFKYFVVPAVLAILLTLMTSGYHGIKGIRRDLVSALKHE